MLNEESESALTVSLLEHNLRYVLTISQINKLREIPQTRCSVSVDIAPV